MSGSYKNLCQLSKRRLTALLSGNKRVCYQQQFESNSSVQFTEAEYPDDFNNVDNALQRDCVDGLQFDTTTSNVEESCESQTSTIKETEILDIKIFLKNWSVKHNIKNTALNCLLKELKRQGFSNLPNDSRALLETPRSREVSDIFPGKYVHIGIRKGIDHYLKGQQQLPQSIMLDFNVDGAPITKSTNSSVWPILCKVVGSKFVFPIGIYHGLQKPNNFSHYLSIFVDELTEITTSYLFGEVLITIIINCFICDAPAKSSVLGIKLHNGYFGCTKCIQRGEFINRRMTFQDIDAPLRTDESFRSKSNKEFHNSDTIISKLPIDLIKSFPLDYMHLVLLGVVKKMLNLWIDGGHLSKSDCSKISDGLMRMAWTQPSGFQRAIRCISERGHFKATEFRTFLLYTGPFVLRNILPSYKYEHFMLLSTSITLLSAENKNDAKINLAESMLKTFVKEFGVIYGVHHLVHNVHSLIHIAEDVRKFGSVNNFSAFPFESYMFKLKKCLRKNEKPLEQLSNRIEEMYNNEPSITLLDKPVVLILNRGVKVDGKMRYNSISIGEITLDNGRKNRWCLTTNGEIIKFHYSEFKNAEYYIFASEIKEKKTFFDLPIQSTFIDIYETDKNEEVPRFWNVKLIKRKMFQIEENDSRVFFPLIHCE